jgi:hypothetical protein
MHLDVHPEELYEGKCFNTLIAATSCLPFFSINQPIKATLYLIAFENSCLAV